MSLKHDTRIAIIGGGFTGLTAAYELAKQGIPVTVLEAESEIGGLAAAFDVGGEKLDRFYHHWFTNDIHVMQLIEELGLQEKVTINPTNTGVYYANNFFKLSTPWDLLNFTPLSFIDRIRLGLLALRARRVKNWQELEDKTAAEWLKELGGGMYIAWFGNPCSTVNSAPSPTKFLRSGFGINLNYAAVAGAKAARNGWPISKVVLSPWQKPWRRTSKNWADASN